jgi:hypothetical protein
VHIDYDDAEGELLLTAISGKSARLVRNSGRCSAPAAHAFPDLGVIRPHPLAGAAAVAERCALPCPGAQAASSTPSGIPEMNNTMILQPWPRTPKRLRRDTRLAFACSKNCAAACSKSACRMAPARLFGEGEHG